MITFNNEIVRETEKAILVKCAVCWGDGASHIKELWMPKSVIRMDGDVIELPYWFHTKLGKENTYKGYMMSFFYIAEQ